MARNMPCPPPPLLHHGPLPGARWSPHCPPQRGPQTTENQHFIELAPQKSTPADFLFAVGITVTDGGVTSTPPAAHATANPREEGSFWGQATAARAGAGRAVNHEDPRGIIHLLQKKKQKRKNKYETSGASQHSEFKYKKRGHKKTVKKTTEPTRPPPGWWSRGRGPAPPPHWPAACHWRRWRPQSRSSTSSSSKDSLRPRLGDTCRTEVGRGEGRQPGRAGSSSRSPPVPAGRGGRGGEEEAGKVGTREHAPRSEPQGPGTRRGWRERDTALGTRRGRAREAKAPALGRCVRNGTRARRPAETRHACLPGEGAARRGRRLRTGGKRARHPGSRAPSRRRRSLKPKGLWDQAVEMSEAGRTTGSGRDCGRRRGSVPPSGCSRAPDCPSLPCP